MSKKIVPKNDTRYILSLTPNQAHLISSACEFLTRLRIGQFRLLTEELLDVSNADEYCKRRDEAEGLLEKLKKIYFPELQGVGHSYGIHHDERADMAWDVYQVMRNVMAWHEHPEGGITVNFGKPMQTAKEPLPKCWVHGTCKNEHEYYEALREALVSKYGECMDKTQTAKTLGVTRATVYKMIEDGRLRSSCGKKVLTESVITLLMTKEAS